MQFLFLLLEPVRSENFWIQSRIVSVHLQRMFLKAKLIDTMYFCRNVKSFVVVL